MRNIKYQKFLQRFILENFVGVGLLHVQWRNSVVAARDRSLKRTIRELVESFLCSRKMTCGETNSFTLHTSITYQHVT